MSILLLINPNTKKRIIVNYKILYFKTLVLWNFNLIWKQLYYGKNDGTMNKNMVLWTKLWYYTENNGTSIYEGKNMN